MNKIKEKINMKQIKIPVSALNKAINFGPLNLEVKNVVFYKPNAPVAECDFIIHQVIDMRQVSKETCMGRDWTAQECMIKENLDLILNTINKGGLNASGDDLARIGDNLIATYKGLIVIYNVTSIRKIKLKDN